MTDQNKINAIMSMGHMKTWWIFGFEWRGALKPAQMTTKDGKRYIPLFLGLWISRSE